MQDIEDSDNSFYSCSSESVSFISIDGDTTAPTLYDEISSIVSDYPKNFNVVHINAQSVPGHYSDLLASFSSAHLDAILISESFLKPSLPSTHYSLPGFVLIRNDRTGKGCGGVAIYLRANIPFKLISASPSPYSGSAPQQHLFLEISVQHAKVLLGVFYCPNENIDYFNSFETLLHDISSNYNHIIIMGDFNTCLLRDDCRSRKLSSLLSSFNLDTLPLSATHHFPNCIPTLLDLIIVSSTEFVSTHGQLNAPFSHHDLVYLSYRIRPPKRKVQFRLLRNYKSINLEALQHDATYMDWSPIYESTDVNTMVNTFGNKLIDLFDRHAPIHKVRIKHEPAPWLSPTIKNLMACRDRAKSRYKRNQSEHNLSRYKILRNRCRRMCRDAKRSHFHKYLDNQNSSTIWRFLKSVGIGKPPETAMPDIDLGDLNTHFSRPPIYLNSNIKNFTLQSLLSLPTLQIPAFDLSPVTETDVQKSLLSISSSAVGNDNICSRMITPLLPIILPVLTHIFNYSLYSSIFPDSWKLAYIIPLPKTSNPTMASHFRPISILPFLSKVLEHIVHRQLSYFLLTHNLLSSYQSGFRPGHSTTTALLKVTDDIRLAMENKQLTLLVLLDFSSAFNSVDFDILLGILKSINFSATTIAWFDSYLRGRSQYVRVDESSSEWCDLTAGVPQGGVLSPLLFSIFINSATKLISSRFHLYADDLQIYRHFVTADIESAVAEMNRDLCRVSEWAKSFGILINPAKSQAMIIGSRNMRGRLTDSSVGPVLLDGIQIPLSGSVKNLGVYMDSNLSWYTQFTEVSKKVRYAFHSLKCLQSFLPFKTKIYLAQTLILPIIDYADACYLDANEELLDKLERLQNLCIRFIFNLKKYDHVSSYRKELKWLPIRLRRNTRILCLLFNILHNPSAPSYLRERFSFARSPDAPCRSHLRSTLKFPSHKTNFYSFSFSVHAVRLWNSLPADIRDCNSINSFKLKLRQHYLSSIYD